MTDRIDMSNSPINQDDDSWQRDIEVIPVGVYFMAIYDNLHTSLHITPDSARQTIIDAVRRANESDISEVF